MKKCIDIFGQSWIIIVQCDLFQCKALDGTRLLRNLMNELGEFKINMVAGITETPVPSPIF